MDKTDAHPLKTYFKSRLKNLRQILRHPQALLPSLIIMGVWIYLGFWQTRLGESKALSWVNFFTFAQGGLFGGVTGAIGGIVGKILLATLLNALLMPLLVRGSKPFAHFKEGFRKFGQSFTFDSLRALSVFFLGMGLALLLYSFFNITQRWQEGLVGIVGAVLLIRRIGSRGGGFLYSLLLSLFPGPDKKRMPSQMDITRFLSGMTIGFILGTGLNIVGLKWAVLISIASLALGIVLFLFGKRKKAAVTLACLIGLMIVPASGQRGSDPTDRLREATGDLDAALEEYNSLGIDLTNFDADSFAAQMGEYQKQAEDAQRRGKRKEVKRICDQMSAYYKSQLGADMDFYSYYKNFKDSPDSAGKDDSDAGNEDREIMGDTPMTNGWADEDSYADSEAAATTVGAVAGALGAAGAAAGAGGAAGPFGGGPDFPDAPDWDVEESEGFGKEDDDEKPEEEPEDEPIEPEEEPEEEAEEEIPEEEVPEEEVPEEENPEEEASEEEDEESEETGETEESEESEESEEAEKTEEAENAEESEEEKEQEGEEEEESEEDKEEEEEDAGEEEESEEDKEEEEEDAGEEGEDDLDDDDFDDDGLDADEDFSDKDEVDDDDFDDDYEDDGPDQPAEVPAEEPSDEPAQPTEDSGQPAEGPAEESSQPAEDPGQPAEEASEEAVEESAEEEEDDYDYEAERAQRKAEQDAINERYAAAHQQDWEKFSTTSEEERINREIEEENRLTPEQQRQKETILKYAEEHNIDTVDTLGEERDIEDIHRDTVSSIRWDYVNELETQRVAAEDELFYSEAIAEAELVDNVSEGTVNVLGECTGPAGKQVKNWHNFLKTTCVGYQEAKCDGRNRLVGTLGGMAEGGFTVCQNIIGDDGVLPGGGFKKTLAVGTTTVFFEGTKTLIHEGVRGTSLEETVEKAQTAMVKKSGEVLITTTMGATLDKVPGIAQGKFGASDSTAKMLENFGKGTNALIGETYSRGHDMMTVGDTNISEALTHDFMEWKTEQAEKLF